MSLAGRRVATFLSRRQTGPHRLAGRAAWRRHCPSGERPGTVGANGVGSAMASPPRVGLAWCVVSRWAVEQKDPTACRREARGRMRAGPAIEVHLQGAGGAAGAPCRPVGLSVRGGVESGADVSPDSADGDEMSWGGLFLGWMAVSMVVCGLGTGGVEGSAGVQIITTDLGEKLPVPTVVSACPSILLSSAVPRGAARMDAPGTPAPRSGVRVPSNQLKE